MKTLRALHHYLFGELREAGDVAAVDAGEMLVLPHAICHSMIKEPDALCSRAFIGMDSCAACTIAVVSEEPQDLVYTSFMDSNLALRWWSQQSPLFMVDHMNRIAMALEPFHHGQIVRVRLVEGRQFQIFPFELILDEEPSENIFNIQQRKQP